MSRDNTTIPDPKTAAHMYLERGFTPIPWFIGRDGRKCAAIKGFHYKDYSVSHRDIDRWPRAQCGLVMSQRSGFFTLDFDCAQQRAEKFFFGDEDATGDWGAGAIRPRRTAMQLTGRGLHLVYRGAGGHPWPRDGIWSAEWPDIQIRSNGFVAAWPSVHPNGKRYRWVDDHPAVDPGPLLLMLRPERLPRPGGRGGPGRDGGPDGDLAYYAEHGIVAGWQDSEIHRLACKHVRSMSEAELFSLLWSAACASVQNLHNPWREDDIRSKIRRAKEFTDAEDAGAMAAYRQMEAAGHGW